METKGLIDELRRRRDALDAAIRALEAAPVMLPPVYVPVYVPCDNTKPYWQSPWISVTTTATTGGVEVQS